ncbi:hypothetical protein EMIHUDRAFT_357618 [Emiliania huxleyi CCMP1516]|uniref:RING-type domain-containing protein n=2 Tax=Emiliania huxleyi TaxID=2903 RepID=A0A0D3IKS3_EMIH1|nr:hypothetical protein EMIHUDRAFT_357618 [Emiliania huxleyi CCMP1516]EOD11858.1 hypothetical protein EMIHUDRAFT_357618 [Emiliania huxleyi CCMP1516]|eukprot:XP_005764287.1 hypothetical protein EMIHUDRAFT_357618 [Emiliania huxleyi CCMP1516]
MAGGGAVGARASPAQTRPLRSKSRAPRGDAPLPRVEALPAELVADLTDPTPTATRAGVHSMSRRAGDQLGGTADADRRFWKKVEEDSTLLRVLKRTALQRAPLECRAAREARLSELLQPPLSLLRARAVCFRREPGDSDGSALHERCRSWDAAPLASPFRAEVDVLDLLAEYRINSGNSVDTQPGEEVVACTICGGGVDSRPPSEAEVAAGLAVRLAIYRPCLHKACDACLSTYALSSGASALFPSNSAEDAAARRSYEALGNVAQAVMGGHLKCPLCQAVVEWPWRLTAPLLKVCRPVAERRAPVAEPRAPVG